MSVLEALLVALFIIFLVFTVLVCLWAVLRLLGAVFIKLDALKAQAQQNAQNNQAQG